jgi:hypothetical protein
MNVTIGMQKTLVRMTVRKALLSRRLRAMALKASRSDARAWALLDPAGGGRRAGAEGMRSK